MPSPCMYSDKPRRGRIASLRDYHLMYPNLVVRTANSMSATALPLLVLSLGFPAHDVGWIVSLGGLSTMLTSVIGGFVSDRIDRRRLMLLGVLGVALSTALYGLARTSAQLISLRLSQGIFTGIFRPASQAMAYELNPARPGYVLGLVASSYALGNSVGPALGGFVADLQGRLTWSMTLASAIAVSGALYLISVSHTLPSRPSADTRGARDMQRARPSPRSWHTSGSLAPFLTVMIDAWVLNCWYVFLPVHLKERGFGFAEVGAMLGLYSLTYVISQPFAGKVMDSIGPRVPVCASLLAHGVLTALLPVLESTTWFIGCVALLGCVSSIAYAGCVVMAARGADDAKRGMSLGLLSSASNFGQFIGPIFGSSVLATFGSSSAVFYACLGPALVGATAPFWMSRDSGPSLERVASNM